MRVRYFCDVCGSPQADRPVRVRLPVYTTWRGLDGTEYMGWRGRPREICRKCAYELDATAHRLEREGRS